MDSAVARGRRVMADVYGAEFAAQLPEPVSPVQHETLGHLFADIWSRPGLALRDRRLLLIGLASALGRADIIETQVYGALVNDELSAVELDEIVLQMHFYAGWPQGTQVRAGVERATQRFAVTTQHDEAPT